MDNNALRRERFAAEYVLDLNARQAAIRAGAPPRGAHVTAARYLRHPEVRRLIRRLQAKHLQQVGLSAERTLEELRRIAFTDPAECLDGEGNLRPLQDIPEDVRSAIASIEVVQRISGDGVVDQIVKIKFWSKLAALELLARHLELLEHRTPTADDGQRLVAAIREGQAHARKMLWTKGVAYDR